MRLKSVMCGLTSCRRGISKFIRLKTESEVPALLNSFAGIFGFLSLFLFNLLRFFVYCIQAIVFRQKILLTKAVKCVKMLSCKYAGIV